MAPSSRHHTSLTATLLTAAGGTGAVLPYVTSTVSAQRPSHSIQAEQSPASDVKMYEGWMDSPKPPKTSARARDVDHDDSPSFYGYTAEEIFGTVTGPDGVCLYHWGLGCGADVSEGPKNGTLDCGAKENIVNYTWECQPLDGSEKSARGVLLAAVLCFLPVGLAAVAVGVAAVKVGLTVKAVAWGVHAIVQHKKNKHKPYPPTPYPKATAAIQTPYPKATAAIQTPYPPAIVTDVKSISRGGGGGSGSAAGQRAKARQNNRLRGGRGNGRNRNTRRTTQHRSRRSRRNGEEDWAAEDMTDATISSECRIGGEDSVSCTTVYVVLACVLLLTLVVVLGVWKCRGQKKTASTADHSNPSPAEIKTVQN